MIQASSSPGAFLEGGALRFAFLDEPPFCYRAPDGVVTGCDVALARIVAQRIGASAFTPIETEFAQLLPGLNDSRWDMTTGLFITEARRETAAFSRPIWALPDGLLVREENRGAIDGYISLARGAWRLGVVRDQVQQQTALRLGVRRDRISIFGVYAEAAEAVASGAIDAFASVATAHRGYLARHAQGPLAVVEVPEREKAAEQGAFAFANKSAALREQVDRALADFLGSTEHRALMARFGFTPEEVDRIAPSGA